MILKLTVRVGAFSEMEKGRQRKGSKEAGRLRGVYLYQGRRSLGMLYMAFVKRSILRIFSLSHPSCHSQFVSSGFENA